MRIKGVVRRLAVSVAAVVAMTGGIVVATTAPAQAYATICRTVTTNSQASFAIVPQMYVPVCYNGSTIWQNGNVSGKVNTFGYVLNGIDWVGTFNGMVRF